MRIPAGDNLPRAVCTACGTIHYQNPRIVVGCVPEWQGRILLCQRAIAPRRGYWTTPAGFLENGETLQAAAARESLEEAQAQVQDRLAAVDHPRSACSAGTREFPRRLLEGKFGVGAESLQVGLYQEAEIPWEQIAFPSIEFALRSYFEDRRLARESLHFSDITRPLQH
jgi:ADP-ribose pyrophosphatase YjhB (NUDIX family)